MNLKRIPVLILVAAAVALVGCDGGGDEDGEETASPSPAASTPDTTPSPTEETETATPDDETATPTEDDGAATATPTEEGDGAGGGDLAQVGEQVAQQAGCGACHGVGIAPPFEGLAGSERTFEDGSTATADEAYIRESIVTPDAKVVEGFSADLMPENFAETLSEEDIDALIAYIQSLE